MALDLVPFAEGHLDEAAALVAVRIEAQRDALPLLPDPLASAHAVFPHLAHLVEHGSGVALLEGSRLAGFLGALHVPLFGGTPGAYVPEWGHGAAAGTGGEAYRRLYRAAAAAWSDRGRSTHAVTLLSLDRAAEHSLFEHGFGLVVIDAIRHLSGPGSAPAIEAGIRPARAADADSLGRLAEAVAAHLAAPPTFRVDEHDLLGTTEASRLADETNIAFVAESEGVILGWVGGTPGAGTYPLCTDDPSTVRLDRAFTLPEARRSGIATSLVTTFLGEAARRGYHRCVVDYESANPEAAGFWPSQGFVPFCRSLVRFVAPQLVTAPG